MAAPAKGDDRSHHDQRADTGKRGRPNGRTVSRLVDAEKESGETQASDKGQPQTVVTLGAAVGTCDEPDTYPCGQKADDRNRSGRALRREGEAGRNCRCKNSRQWS